MMNQPVHNLISIHLCPFNTTQVLILCYTVHIVIRKGIHIYLSYPGLEFLEETMRCSTVPSSSRPTLIMHAAYFAP